MVAASCAPDPRGYGNLSESRAWAKVGLWSLGAPVRSEADSTCSPSTLHPRVSSGTTPASVGVRMIPTSGISTRWNRIGES